MAWAHSPTPLESPMISSNNSYTTSAAVLSRRSSPRVSSCVSFIFSCRLCPHGRHPALSPADLPGGGGCGSGCDCLCCSPSETAGPGDLPEEVLVDLLPRGCRPGRLSEECCPSGRVSVRLVFEEEEEEEEEEARFEEEVAELWQS